MEMRKGLCGQEGMGPNFRASSSVRMDEDEDTTGYDGE